MNNITIVLGSTSRLAGGLFSSVRDLAIGITKRGAGIDVLSLRDRYTNVDLLEWEPIKPKLFSAVYPKRLGYSPGLNRALRECKSEIIQQHGIWQAFSLGVNSWKKQSNGHLIISPHGMLDSWALRQGRWKKRIAGAMYARHNLESADCIRALNESEATSIRALGLKVPIAVIPNGVSLPQMDAKVVSHGDLIGENRRIVLFLGRIHPKKGLGELIDAWAILLGYHKAIEKEWVLVIAGWDDGGYLPGLCDQISRLKLNDHIRILGSQYGAEKDCLLRNSSAFVLPSYSEGLPMAVLEAWAHCKPVFMTSECNLAEGFTTQAAIRVTTHAEELASKLKEWLFKSELEEMGKRGRELVEERYTWGSIVDEFDRLHKWLLSECDVPLCVKRSSHRSHPA